MLYTDFITFFFWKKKNCILFTFESRLAGEVVDTDPREDDITGLKGVPAHSRNYYQCCGSESGSEIKAKAGSGYGSEIKAKAGSESRSPEKIISDPQHRFKQKTEHTTTFINWSKKSNGQLGPKKTKDCLTVYTFFQIWFQLPHSSLRRM